MSSKVNFGSYSLLLQHNIHGSMGGTCPATPVWNDLTSAEPPKQLHNRYCPHPQHKPRCHKIQYAFHPCAPQAPQSRHHHRASTSPEPSPLPLDTQLAKPTAYLEWTEEELDAKPTGVSYVGYKASDEKDLRVAQEREVLTHADRNTVSMMVSAVRGLQAATSWASIQGDGWRAVVKAEGWWWLWGIAVGLWTARVEVERIPWHPGLCCNEWRFLSCRLWVHLICLISYQPSSLDSAGPWTYSDLWDELEMIKKAGV